MNPDKSAPLQLEVQDLAIARGGIVLASGIAFALEPGSGLITTGANGAGKSTLLRVVAGLLAAHAGRVTLAGGGDIYPDMASASHYLGHLNAMKPALSVLENLSFWQQLTGLADQTIDAALEQTGLSHVRDLPFGYLSTGQKRRIAIARLLLNRRPVWILDEPTAGLDAASSANFAAMMQSHMDGGGMLIAATHAPLGLEGLQTLEISGDTAGARAGNQAGVAQS